MVNQNMVVIYQSKYGWARRYAEWIAEALQCDLRENKKTTVEDLAPYDTIIYGAGIYSGIVAGTKRLFNKGNEEALSGKTMVLFSVGINDPSDAKNMYNIRTSLGQQITDAILVDMQLFHLWGGMNYKNLSWLDRVRLSFMQRFSKDDRISQAGMANHGKSVDMISKAAIEPIVAYVKGLKLM